MAGFASRHRAFVKVRMSKLQWDRGQLGFILDVNVMTVRHS